MCVAQSPTHLRSGGRSLCTLLGVRGFRPCALNGGAGLGCAAAGGVCIGGRGRCGIARGVELRFTCFGLSACAHLGSQ